MALEYFGSGGIEKSHSCKWAKWIQWHALPHIQPCTQQWNKGYYPNLHGWGFSIPPSPYFSTTGFTYPSTCRGQYLLHSWRGWLTLQEPRYLTACLRLWSLLEKAFSLSLNLACMFLARVSGSWNCFLWCLFPFWNGKVILSLFLPGHAWFCTPGSSQSQRWVQVLWIG